jgi:hypothetical protein
LPSVALASAAPLGRRSRAARAGTAAIVPPNTTHSVRALAASAVIVVDQGVRTDVGAASAELAIDFRNPTDAAVPFEIRNHGRGDAGSGRAASVSRHRSAPSKDFCGPTS